MTILTKEQLDALTQFDAPTICNAIEAFNIQPRTASFMKPGMELRLPLGKPTTDELRAWRKAMDEARKAVKID